MVTKRSKNEGKDRVVTEGYLDTRLEKTRGYLDARLEDAKHEIKTEITEEFRGQTAKVLQAVDKIATRFDLTEKDRAAHTHLHKRITDDFHAHAQRIKKLETKA